MEKIQAAIEKARALREQRLAGSLPEDDAPAPPRDAKDNDPHLKAMEKARAKAATLAPPHANGAPAAPAAPRAAAPQPQPPQPARAPAPARPAEKDPRQAVSEPEPRRTGPRAPRFHLHDARSIWQELTPFKPDPAQMRRHRIVSYERSDPAHVSFDMMRTRLVQHLRTNGWTSVAITSPGPSCGKTTTSLNLAFALAYQQDTRTVLMDVDLRRPNMARILGLKEVHSMASILDGSGTIESNFVRYGENLAIGTNERPARHPSELLQHSNATAALANLREKLAPDVIIFDMPPMMSNDDVMAFLPHVDCVLLVAAAETTTIDEVDRCERELASQTNVLGVVLNMCRYATEKYGYY